MIVGTVAPICHTTLRDEVTKPRRLLGARDVTMVAGFLVATAIHLGR